MNHGKALVGHNLIYFSPGKWDDLWRNRHHLMSVFARCNKVLFVEPRLYLRSALHSLRGGEWFGPRVPSIRRVSENLFVFRYPTWAPISGRFPIGWFTRVIRRLSLQRALRQLRMSQPIVWFSHPSMADLIYKIPQASLLIYHVVDEYTAYIDQTPASRRWTKEQEKAMMAKVDAVIVVSSKLYEAKRPFNANTYLVPNGVDYQAYTSALADPSLPDDLSTIDGPRLGYSGLVGDKLNLSMLKELAQENPEWSLVFLGAVGVSRQAETWQQLIDMPNVHYLGMVDVHQVPHYLKGFDVGLMPYRQNRHAEHISPLKLYDYLAAGLPVASMDIPAAREFSRYIHLAERSQDFAQAVRSALADVAPERRQARRHIAAQHTWEARVGSVSELIQSLLASKAAN